MTRIFRPLALCALLVAAACTNTTSLPSGSATGSAGAIVPGSASDPSSAAYFQQTVGDRVTFFVDESTLNDASRSILAKQAQWLMANGSYTAVIEGHADEQGTREYNLALGARRASSVLDYLVAQGVAPGRLRTVTFGKERPLEVCSEEACYSRNRRAVTVLAGGVSS